MLSLLHNLDPRSYTHRTYVISSGDEFSALKATEFEHRLAERVQREGEEQMVEGENGEKKQGGKGGAGTYSIRTVPRARKIHQSLLTAPISCLYCLVACLRLLITSPLSIPSSSSSSSSSPPIPTPTTSPSIPTIPDLILLNGPATATILVFASLLLRFFGVKGSKGKMRSIYVESWARVRKLSLSGRILVAVGACERVLVQWEGLKGSGNGVEFRGCLVR